MKEILAQLHKIASYLEDNNYLEDSKEINKVFVKLSDKKIIWQPKKENPYQTETQHQYSRLKNNKNETSLSNDITAYDDLLDTRIRNAPAYSYYQDLYIAARDEYQKQLTKFRNPQFQSNKKETAKLKYLKADWEAKVENFENWFFKALIQAKNQGAIPGIPKQEVKPVTQSVQTKPTVKQVAKPVPATKPNAVIKDNPVSPISPAETDTNKTTRKPIMELNMNDRVQPYIDRYNELKAKVGKNKAYNEMQATVYNEDNTPSKTIYRTWENFINLQ
jgi:cell fate (sporulation/competence/biofilm development) regulator YlbF (YheA/YmcA/DUF963 family)